MLRRVLPPAQHAAVALAGWLSGVPGYHHGRLDVVAEADFLDAVGGEEAGFVAAASRHPFEKTVVGGTCHWTQERRMI